jgi:hypothetical protein
MKEILNRDVADSLLTALGEQVAAAEEKFELVVIGGSGLLALGLVERATRDVDIVALRKDSELQGASPLPAALRTARDRVHFASRIDQIHFKLYAAVDQGPGKHSADLEAMDPTDAEMLQAARWTLTHDPSPEFKEVLQRVLSHYGVDDGGL